MPENSKRAIMEASKELLQKMVAANGVKADDLACIFFTTTSDLNAAFPAAAARELGWRQVAMLCGHEMDVPGSLPRCLRVMMLFNSQHKDKKIVNVYLGEAQQLTAEMESNE